MIYLDHAATSFPKPEQVYRGMESFVRASGANPGRSGHRRAVAAEAMIEETRRLVARLFDFSRPERVVFTLNATDALNMAIKGVLKPGDHVITSVLEHNSVARPLNRLESDGIITVTRLAANSDHVIDPDDVKRAIKPTTKLVAITHASNVTGTIQPVSAFGRLARDAGALLLVDASQSAGVVPIQIDHENIDLLAFTGHKGLLGPTGTGGLVVGERAQVAPWREGGTGGGSESPLQPTELPHRLEGGTPNVFGLAGLREGVRILLERGVQSVLDHERSLLQEFHKAIKDPSRFRWYSADHRVEGKVGLVSLNIPGFMPAEVAAILDQEFDIAARPGLHCAPSAHAHLGTVPGGTLRLSVGFQNTAEEMRQAAAALEEIASLSNG